MELEPRMYDSSTSVCEAVKCQNGWRIKLWTFLVRPYLESLWQFRKLVEYFEYMVSDNDSNRDDFDPPTLRSIKAGFECKSNNQMGSETEDFNIGTLFV